MNRRNLNALLVNYGNNYSRIQEKGSYQATLSKAIEAFSAVRTEIEAQNGQLSGALRKQQEALSDLFDNGTKLPLHGMILLADRCPLETERLFMSLAEDDKGNLAKRQGRINAFREEANALMEANIGSMWKYEQSFRDVMTYQYLMRPADNYLYRYSEAKCLSDCIENSDAVRSGKYYSLEAYYNMCRNIIREMKEQKNLREYMNDDEVNNSILVADLMMCAKKYDLYRNIKMNLPARRSAVGKAAREEELRQRREEIKRLEEKLAGLKEELDHGRDLLKKEEGSTGLTGRILRHKKFGQGTVVQDNGRTVQIDFNGTLKSFQMPDSLVKGFLTAEAENLDPSADEKYKIVENNKSLETQIGRVKLSLEVLYKMEQ